jgi:hypothetical protein
MFQGLTLEQIKKQGFVVTPSGDKYYWFDVKNVKRFAIEKPKNIFDTYKVFGIGESSVELMGEFKKEWSASMFMRILGETE